MDEIQNPTSLINKDYEEIELVTLDDWLDNFDELSKYCSSFLFKYFLPDFGNNIILLFIWSST